MVKSPKDDFEGFGDGDDDNYDGNDGVIYDGLRDVDDGNDGNYDGLGDVDDGVPCDPWVRVADQDNLASRTTWLGTQHLIIILNW